MTERRMLWGVGLIALGIALHVLYEVLKAAEEGKIGAPSDIGGGGIPLAGYTAAAWGVVLLVRELLDRRSGQR